MKASTLAENKIRLSVERVPLSPSEPHTLAELFLKSAKERPRRNALNYKAQGVWRSISSAEMISRIQNIALGLFSLGVRKGDRAALLAANSPEWTLTDAGCQLLGAVDVPIYTTLAADSVKYIVKDSGAKFFFCKIEKRLPAFEKFCPNVLLWKNSFFSISPVLMRKMLSH